MTRYSIDIETQEKIDGWYLIVRVDGKDYEPNGPPLGPFPSEAQAEAAARDLISMLASVNN